MSPELRKSSSAYRQIADDISSRIMSGEYAAGSTIPSTRQIMASWGVSMSTASKAHSHLRQLGLISATPGIGNVVEAQTGGAHSRLEATRLSGAIYRKGEWAKIVSAELMPAPSDVQSELGLPSGQNVVRRERITHTEEHPVSASVSWMPGYLADRAPEILSLDRIQAGALSHALHLIGSGITRGREEVCAGGAAPDAAFRLEVNVGAPVLLARNWYYDASGAVVEFSTSVRRAGRLSRYVFSA
jgi:DNA-binding GntR family transcriptional regulator